MQKLTPWFLDLSDLTDTLQKRWSGVTPLAAYFQHPSYAQLKSNWDKEVLPGYAPLAQPLLNSTESLVNHLRKMQE